MARQLLRLRQSRTSDTYDDQKTPAEILQAELLALSAEEYTNFIISQIRQILGTADWKESVPATLAELAVVDQGVVLANCLSTDAVGDFVCVTGDMVAGRYQAEKADVTNRAKMPAWGVIESKSAATDCAVRYRGIAAGLYTGLTPGGLYFVGLDSRPVLGIASIPPRGFRQHVGVAIAEDSLLLERATEMIRGA